MKEITLSIIKPDATSRNLIGKIIARFEEDDLQVVGMKMKHLSTAEAKSFYAEHKDRPFYGELVEFMTSEPVVIMALYGKDAIAKNRVIMGATDPKKAASGTIRHMFARNVGENSVHGSDSAEAAKREIKFFFSDIETYLPA